jgi:GT2 family glycosyltransferase
MKLKIAVLITCHNRKESTQQCLTYLFSQKGLNDLIDLEVFLVDDGCTDGTPELIRRDFPQVNIIKGTGQLYWNRGMHLAWQTAVNTKDFDYYLWLNDDTFLYSNALESLFIEVFPDTIICGSTTSALIKKLTYGGYKNNPHTPIAPSDIYQDGECFNGNYVLIPRSVYNQLGNLDPIFKHALGDFDYGYRAIKAGFKIKVAPGFVGICEVHDSVPSWRNSSVNVFKRLIHLYSGLSGIQPFEFFVFEKRHFGIRSALYRFFLSHLRAIFPWIWEFKTNK